MIRIDQEKCIGCLNCTDKCPCSSIRKDPETGKARFNEETGCIRCMHCAIACASGAITYDEKMAVKEYTGLEMPEDLPEKLRDLIRMRRSYRLFSDERVPMEVIREALELASWAPSAKNQHPVKYYVMDGDEEIARVMEIILAYYERERINLDVVEAFRGGNNRILARAHTVIMAYARNNAVNPQTDTAIALATAELYLQSRGIGTCWSGYLMRALNACEELKEIFPLPENNSFYGCLLVGYPTEKYFGVPERLKHADIRFGNFEKSGEK